MDCSTPGPPVLHYLMTFYFDSWPLSRWCHPTISSSVVPFSSCSQSFPASLSFPESAPDIRWPKCGSFSIGWLNTQGWSLGLTGLISLQSKGLWSVFSSTTIWKHQFLSTRPSLDFLCGSVKNLPTMQETLSNPWVRKIPWRRAWQHTPVFLPGESHGQRSPAGYSPWGHKELDATERLTYTHSLLYGPTHIHPLPEKS